MAETWCAYTCACVCVRLYKKTLFALAGASGFFRRFFKCLFGGISCFLSNKKKKNFLTSLASYVCVCVRVCITYTICFGVQQFLWYIRFTVIFCFLLFFLNFLQPAKLSWRRFCVRMFRDRKSTQKEKKKKRKKRTIATATAIIWQQRNLYTKNNWRVYF